MERMIHGYLDFVRGDGDEEFADVDVEAVFEKLAASALVHKDLTLHLDIAPITVPARPMAFQRAMANVVNNAARFAEEIWVSGRVDGEKFHIQIEDNGPGIPPELYDEVFKPFTRVETSRNQNTGGIGLGLAITMDIVHSHGGKIFLTESPHGGLCVTMRMPLK
jgi:two-component system osmolarity sensor histidine kinase EnvZ